MARTAKLTEFGLAVPLRKGMGLGRGRGYYNIAPQDSYIHYLAGKGIKIQQPVFSHIAMGHNPLELTLYVPSTEKDNKGQDIRVSDAEYEARINDAEKKMSKLFGGYTKVDTQGGWYNADKGKLVEEDVATVTSFTKIEDFEENKSKFEDYVEKIRKEYEQDAMSIEFEGDLYFYEPDTDGDGVPDSKDCDPNDPTKQDNFKPKFEYAPYLINFAREENAPKGWTAKQYRFSKVRPLKEGLKVSYSVSGSDASYMDSWRGEVRATKISRKSFRNPDRAKRYMVDLMKEVK